MQLISTRKTSGRSYQVWATLNMPEHTQLKVTPAKLSFEKKTTKKTIYLYWWSKNYITWLVWCWHLCLYGVWIACHTDDQRIKQSDWCEVDRGAYIGVMMMNDDEVFSWYGWPDGRHLALFPVRTIVRDPHHHESLTRQEQGLNLRRTWLQR